MTVVVADRHSLSVDSLQRVAFEYESVELAEVARERITSAHEAFERFASEQPASEETDWRERERRARQLPAGPLAFSGELLPEELSRACVLATLATVVEGHTGAHVEQAEALIALLASPLPQLPSQGPIEQRPEWGQSAGLANAAAVASAMASFASVLSERRFAVAERVFALSVEAFDAPLEAYDLGLAELWGDPHESDALESLSRLLEGGTPATRRRPYQAPVSYRILPRVLGAGRRAVAELREVADGALATAAAEPLFLPPTELSPQGRMLWTGGSHQGLTAPALDAVTATWVDLAAIAYRHIVKLHMGAVSRLPHLLMAPADGSSPAFSTAALAQIAEGFYEELRRLAQPTLLSGGAVTAYPDEDIASPTQLAFRIERRAAKLFDGMLAILAVSSSQALFVTEREAPPALAGLLETVRERCPPVSSRRPLAAECELVAAAFSEAISAGAAWLSR
jgi:histidine ammonia-lyase